MEKKQISQALDIREKKIAEEMIGAIADANSKLNGPVSLELRGNQVFFKRQVKIVNFDELKWLGLTIFPMGNMVIELIGKDQDLKLDHEREFKITDRIVVKNNCDMKEFPLEIKVVVEDELDFEMLDSYATDFTVGNATFKWVKQ